MVVKPSAPPFFEPLMLEILGISHSAVSIERMHVLVEVQPAVQSLRERNKRPTASNYADDNLLGPST
jgi:hypothetical protein